MRPFLFIAILFNACILHAQITVTNATFPQPGDTLLTATDNLPANISINAGGGNQSWDYRSLQAPFIQQTVILPAASGIYSEAFPAANIFTEIQVGQGGETGEAYYSSGTSTYDFLGYVGAAPVNLGIKLTVRFNPSLTERRAPLNYGDKNTGQYSVVLPIASADLPKEILDSLPIRPDSIRVRVNSNRTDEADAWGNLILPNDGIGETYEVLREKRTDIRETRLDIKIGFLPWQDITDLLIGQIPGIGLDTLISYHFFSNVAKEPIAIVIMNRAGTAPASVTFKGSDFTSKVQYIRSGRATVFAYPNPAIDDVRFEFTNLEAGKYDLKIYNILGVEVWKQNYYLNGSKTVKADISKLKKGTYLYSLVNEAGKTITTKRLMVIRP